MRRLIAVTAVVLMGLSSAACTSSTPAGPNAAYNKGGQSAVKGSVRYNARAHCTRTGKTGRAYRQSSPADAAAKAIGMCIRNGGIPACCHVDEITPVRA